MRQILALRSLLFLSRATALALACLASCPSPAVPGTPSPPLRVAVYDLPPYGYKDADGAIVGLSVDLWRRVAERLGRSYTLTPLAEMAEVLGGVEQGRYDLAIGAITITPDREERVDFSYPAHRSGVAVALRRRTGPLDAFKDYVGAAVELGGLIGVILAALVATGVAMWIIERHSQRAGHGEAAVATLRDGLYWAVVTMTTVGYGDKTPKTHSGRLVATLWMFGSLVLISLLTTSLVSRLTAERVERSDAALGLDLAKQTLGAVSLSSGAEYLAALHLPYAASRNLPDALGLLEAGKTTAVVNSVGALRYAVAKGFSKDIVLADGLLAPAYMAFALPRGSALERPLDEALAKITGSPDWTRFEDRFFAK